MPALDEIKLWRIADGKLARDFPKTHADAVLALEFSPDDTRLASGAADKMARTLDLIVAGGEDSVLRVWNADDGKPRASYPPPPATVTKN